MAYKDSDLAKQKRAQRYQENKEAILERNAQYREKNRDAINKQKREHYQQNKEVILEKRAKYVEENKEAVLKCNAKYIQSLKQNVSYIATVGSDFYFGHTTQGLERRKQKHFSDMKAGKGCPGLQKHFDELGEEAFKEAFDMQILGTFETVEEAMAEEAYLLSKYVGTPGCLNVRLT